MDLRSATVGQFLCLGKIGLILFELAAKEAHNAVLSEFLMGLPIWSAAGMSSPSPGDPESQAWRFSPGVLN